MPTTEGDAVEPGSHGVHRESARRSGRGAEHRASLHVALLGDPVEAWLEPIRSIPAVRVYTIACLRAMSGREVRQAWDAGADDVMSARGPAEELAGRVDALERIRRWVGQMGDDFAVVDVDINRLKALRDLPQILACEFEQMVGESFAVEELSESPQSEYAAELPLSLVSSGVELTMGVGLPHATVGGFSQLLFGEAVGCDALCDAVREFANTAAGAIKRSAIDEGVIFSMGLPVDSTLHQPAAGARAWCLATNDLRITVWISSRSEKPRRITAGMLREGMVLAQPVKNGGGMILVPEGSVLTQRTVSRLLDILGPGGLVEVTRVA